MKKPLIIAIDGPAGAGKSTTARRVAEHLGYAYIDTGAMYRAVTLKALRTGCPLEDAALKTVARELALELSQSPDGQRTILDGTDVTNDLRLPDVTNAVSIVAACPSVRRAMVLLQRRIGNDGGVVMDGRDIGSVVFPNAHVKVFLVADVEERIRRRLAEATAQGQQLSADDVRQQIVERDRIDSSRDDSPLVRAEGAVDIDTTSLTINDQVQRILDLVEVYHKTYSLFSTFGSF
jgi:cytidylate kinase